MSFSLHDSCIVIGLKAGHQESGLHIGIPISSSSTSDTHCLTVKGVFYAFKIYDICGPFCKSDPGGISKTCRGS